jgi:2-dehydro-3-deoxygluconokinase
MKTTPPRKIVAVGEAMLEMSPAEVGLFRLDYAGDTFNTLWHAAQLLGPRADAGFVTRVGTDRLSENFVAEMVADGLDVSGVGRDQDRTMGLYLIELDGAERSFHYWRHHSAARRLADDPDFLSEALSGADIIHISGITLAIVSPQGRETLYAVLDAARSGGAKVAFDPNIRPRLWSSREETRATYENMLMRTDIALPSFDDEASLWGDTTPERTIQRLQNCGVGEVAVKNGPHPIVFTAAGKEGVCDTPAASEVRDTTGAGDAFNAGYLAFRLLGSTPLQAIGMGQELAREVIAVIGARVEHSKLRELFIAVEGRQLTKFK